VKNKYAIRIRITPIKGMKMNDIIACSCVNSIFDRTYFTILLIEPPGRYTILDESKSVLNSIPNVKRGVKATLLVSVAIKNPTAVTKNVVISIMISNSAHVFHILRKMAYIEGSSTYIDTTNVIIGKIHVTKNTEMNFDMYKVPLPTGLERYVLSVPFSSSNAIDIVTKREDASAKVINVSDNVTLYTFDI